MTVILSLLTQEGIVFVSDSREVFLKGGNWMTREPVQKIFPLGNSILYATSGEIGMTQRIGDELEKQFKGQSGVFKRPIEELKIRLRDWVFPIIKDTAEHSIPIRGWPEPQLHTIFSGWTDNEFWILEIDPRGNIEDCTHRGFCAAGSGGLTSQFAIQCLSHLEINRRKIYQGQVVGYRIIDDVLRSGDPFVGGDVQMWVITTNGVNRIESGKLREIHSSVVIWKEIEKDSLGKLKEPG